MGERREKRKATDKQRKTWKNSSSGTRPEVFRSCSIRSKKRSSTRTEPQRRRATRRSSTRKQNLEAHGLISKVYNLCKRPAAHSQKNSLRATYYQKHVIFRVFQSSRTLKIIENCRKTCVFSMQGSKNVVKPLVSAT